MPHSAFAGAEVAVIAGRNEMRRSTFIVILLLCLFEQLFAEDFNLSLDRPDSIITAPSQKETLVGLSTKNIEARFGKPDKKDSSSAESSR